MSASLASCRAVSLARVLAWDFCLPGCSVALPVPFRGCPVVWGCRVGSLEGCPLGYPEGHRAGYPDAMVMHGWALAPRRCLGEALARFFWLPGCLVARRSSGLLCRAWLFCLRVTGTPARPATLFMFACAGYDLVSGCPVCDRVHRVRLRIRVLSLRIHVRPGTLFVLSCVGYARVFGYPICARMRRVHPRVRVGCAASVCRGPGMCRVVGL